MRTLEAFVEFLETGVWAEGVFAADVVGDFNVPGWRFPLNGQAELLAMRRGTGGPWKLSVGRTRSTEDGFVAEIDYVAEDGQYYRSISLVRVDHGLIAEIVHYCTGPRPAS